jgi:phage gp29-like protein
MIGIKGLKNLAGRVNEEYLTLIKSWDKESKIYLEMRDDVIVGTLLDAIKLPLLKAPITVEPAPEHTPGDEAAADWLYETMHKMLRQTWESHVSDMLDSLDFGFAVGEIVLEKRSDGKLWLKNIDPRGQETLDTGGWGFGIGKERDTALVFNQRDPDSGEVFPIPLNKCVHVAYRGRKGNPQGKSLLRSIYRTWRMCRDLENLEAIGIERDIGGMPVAKLPEGDISDEDETDLKGALKALRQDDAMYLLLPFGVEVEPYGSGGKQYDVGAVIERKQKEILGRGFAQFLKLGMDNVGTQALVQGSQDFFMFGLQSVQSFLLEAWNLQLVPYLFNFNQFAGMTGLPELVWQEPGKVDFAGIINAMNTAITGKLFTPTDVDEDKIRELLGWPELPETERGMPRTPEAPGLPAGFDLKPRTLPTGPNDSDRLATIERSQRLLNEKLDRLISAGRR